MPRRDTFRLRPGLRPVPAVSDQRITRRFKRVFLVDRCETIMCGVYQYVRSVLERAGRECGGTAL
jgi:hypothetical protein